MSFKYDRGSERVFNLIKKGSKSDGKCGDGSSMAIMLDYIVHCSFHRQEI